MRSFLGSRWDAFAFACMVACNIGILAVACTYPQRAIVRSVLELADEVCGENDTVEGCLHKCQDEQAKRAGVVK